VKPPPASALATLAALVAPTGCPPAGAGRAIAIGGDLDALKTRGKLEFMTYEDFKTKLAEGERAEKYWLMADEMDGAALQAALTLGGREVRLGGVAKGAGMIRPDMATMLAYVTTDMALEPDYREAFRAAVDRTFNSISVDGDMSTNDTALLLANGASGVRYASLSADERVQFDRALFALMQELATSIVRDGEGATKLVTLKVTGARSEADARAICRGIANSPLVKTAFFGGDANWGRVVAAAGASGVDLDKDKLALEFCGVQVLKHGGAANYSEAEVSGRMKARDVSLTLDLGLGNSEWTYWTCDFSYDYVKINAEYRT
jgi:glutamate N-acetyltransferase/amino-acid N-acetyltransferase